MKDIENRDAQNKANIRIDELEISLKIKDEYIQEYKRLLKDKDMHIKERDICIKDKDICINKLKNKIRINEKEAISRDKKIDELSVEKKKLKFDFIVASKERDDAAEEAITLKNRYVKIIDIIEIITTGEIYHYNYCTG